VSSLPPRSPSNPVHLVSECDRARAMLGQSIEIQRRLVRSLSDAADRVLDGLRAVATGHSLASPEIQQRAAEDIQRAVSRMVDVHLALGRHVCLVETVSSRMADTALRVASYLHRDGRERDTGGESRKEHKGNAE